MSETTAPMKSLSESPSHSHPIALSIALSEASEDFEERKSTVKVPTAIEIAAGNQPVIDCSDLFPDVVGEESGLYVFRIENMKPELMPNDQFGRFCVADCYIVLSSVEEEEKEGNQHHADNAHLNHRIYTYIGKEAEMDKRFCCAMYAVGLKNAIGGTAKVERVTDSEESKDFSELFGGSLEYIDSSFATESGLYEAEKSRHYPLRVYRLQGKINVYLQLVSPTMSSLTPEYVYLIDAGLEIIQWNGSKSSLAIRSKCRMFCEGVNASERVSRAEIFEINEGEEDEWLNKLLKQEPADESAKKDPDLSGFPVTLYSVPELTSEDEDEEEETTRPSNNVIVSGEKLKRGYLKSDSCYVLDVGCEVFLWIGLGAKPDLKVTAGEIMARVIRLVERPSWLALHRAIEGYEPEAFKLRFPDWAELDPATKLLLRPQRPRSIILPGIQVDVQALYTAKMLFGSYGSLAAEEASIEETFQKANDRLISMTLFMHDRGGRFVRVPTEEQEHLWSGDAYLFLCVYRKEDENANETQERPSATKKDGKKSQSADPLAEDEDDQEAEDDMSSSDMLDGDNESSSDEEKVECIVYYWEGRKASRVAYSAFRFHAQAEMENLVMGMYGCGVSVVQAVQGREPVELLAHLGNRVVVHRGTRKHDRKALGGGKARLETQSDDGKAGGHFVLFHIRTEGRWKTTRAAEISPVSTTSLVTRDCFLVLKAPANGPVEPSNAFLWVGRHARRDDIRNAKELADRILGIYNPNPALGNGDSSHLEVSGSQLSSSGKYRIVSEKLEPKAFWECFVDGHLRLSSAMLSPSSPAPSIGARSAIIGGSIPRFLLCTCSSGNFRVVEISDFVQSDLDTTTCAIVDPGLPDPVYVWCGVEASDVVRSLTRKAVEVWVRETNREKEGDASDDTLDCVKWVEEGKEIAEFRAVFLGWEDGGAAAGKRVKEPGSQFSRDEELRKSVAKRKPAPSS
ncbi:hypothetical protein HDU97_004210 [Phlyctochytrium planicorne]|nr:hypothetical protein HDU97_004210 [Phlyctochytrium planicorne]